MLEQTAWVQILATLLPSHVAAIGTGLLGGPKQDSRTDEPQVSVLSERLRERPPDGPAAVAFQRLSPCTGTLVAPNREEAFDGIE